MNILSRLSLRTSRQISQTAPHSRTRLPSSHGTRSITTTPSIAIIGAGPAGLTLGRLLSNSNLTYKIFERDTSPDHRPGSGSLDVHPNSGQLALKEAGLLEKFNALARHGMSVRIADKQAATIVSLGGKEDKERPEIDRKDLQRILRDSVPKELIQWGAKLERVVKDADGRIVLHLENGSVEAGFKLVVGADGAWSRVRRDLFTPVKPVYAGVTFFTTYIKPGDENHEATAAVVQESNFLAMDGEQKIFIYLLGNGSYFLSVGLHLEESRAADKTILKGGSTLWESVLKSKFANWTPRLTDLIKSSKGDFRAWPLYNMTADAIEWEHVPGATLIGDSAHLTVPTGDGVNNAMFDSLELARAIRDHGVENLDAALEAYEGPLKERAKGAIQKGGVVTDALFGSKAPYSFLELIGVKPQKKDE